MKRSGSRGRRKGQEPACEATTCVVEALDIDEGGLTATLRVEARDDER
jgi:hypothetical protein